MTLLVWLLSSLALTVAVLIYLVSPKVEIVANTLVVDVAAAKSLDSVKRVSWNDASMLFKDQIIHPESLSHDPTTGDIFTGTYEGYVWKINKDLTHAEIILRTGDHHPKCGSPEYQKICGRVLGLKFVSPHRLIVADAYFGIISIDIKSKTKRTLVKPDSNALTNSLRLFNSVDVSKDGIVYFTVTSMKWTLHDFIYSFLEADSTGRVYSYNLNTNQLVLLTSNLTFANGIVISHEGDSLLVSDCTKRRVVKININEPSKVSIFLDNLPGPTDNIKAGPDGSYYVAIPTTNSLEVLSFIFAYPSINEWSAWLLPKWMLHKFLNVKSYALKVDGNGNIIQVIMGDNSDIKFITEAYEYNGNILLGSILTPHLTVLRKQDMKDI